MMVLNSAYRASRPAAVDGGKLWMSGTETLWQELICRLEGVQAAQVVFAESGMPCEIHVLAGRCV